MNDCIDDIIMPFGKHKGEYVCDLPIGYLEWLYDNIELNGDLAEAVDRAIDDHYDKS
jgi:uncharacterized protein (DUF3820 family)